MTTSFPTGLDAFTNPTPSNTLDDPSVRHSEQHSNINDAVEALEAKVGVTTSTATSSHDYKLGFVQSSNRAAPCTASPTGVATVYLDGTGQWSTPAGGGGGGSGVSSSASFLTLATNSTLDNERVVTSGSMITLTDAGAGSTLTIAVTASAAAFTGGTLSGVSLVSSAVTITGGTISAVTFASSSVSITAGVITGITTFGASGVSITGGAISGVSLASSSVSITGGAISAVALVSSSVSITGGTLTGITSFGASGVSITGGAISGVSLASSSVSITGGAISAVTLASSSVSITGGTLVGITSFSASGVAITSGTISGVSVASSSVSITGGTISAVTLASSSVAITGGTISGATIVWTHATQHQSGGTDAIQLDNLAATDDNTDLNTTTTAHGLMPKLGDDADKYFNGGGSQTYPFIAPTKFVQGYEDFIGGDAGTMGTRVTGSGATVAYTTAVANHDGIATLSTGTTTAGAAAVGAITGSNNTSNVILGEGAVVVETDVRVPTLSTGTDTFTVRSGLIDNNFAESTDGIFFRYTDSVNSGKWECVAISNTTSTVIDGGVTVSGSSFYRLRAEITAGGTSASFTINGTTVTTGPITTNIPTGASRATGWCSMIAKSAGTTARSFDVDYMYFNKQFTTPR